MSAYEAGAAGAGPLATGLVVPVHDTTKNAAAMTAAGRTVLPTMVRITRVVGS
jgi:hypothetical protein